MLIYVSLAGVSDEWLGFMGYVLIDEDEEFKVYLHHGDRIIVKKSDPFIYVDDINDAQALGNDIFGVEREDE